MCDCMPEPGYWCECDDTSACHCFYEDGPQVSVSEPEPSGEIPNPPWYVNVIILAFIVAFWAMPFIIFWLEGYR